MCRRGEVPDDHAEQEGGDEGVDHRHVRPGALAGRSSGDALIEVEKREGEAQGDHRIMKTA
jgi:hypothetical protein